MVPALLGMRPRYVEKLWGGDRLARLPAKQRLGHAPPVGVRIGESWEVADLPAGSSTVEGGPLHGATLFELVERFGAALVGDAAPVIDGRARFPLLLKLIDAGDDLSVQVHPDATWAATHPGTSSKDEAWLVVEAATGARVLHGTRDDVDAASFRAALDARRADAALRSVPVRAGDLLRVEPGTLHAIGRGCLLLEVQEPSDTTFRVWDFDRVDVDGKKRALHVEEALAVARFGSRAPPLLPRPAPGQPAVVAPGYTLTLVEVAAGRSASLPSTRAGVAGAAFALSGAVRLDAADGVSVELQAGGSAVVCAHAPRVTAHSERGATVVMVSG